MSVKPIRLKIAAVPMGLGVLSGVGYRIASFDISKLYNFLYMHTWWHFFVFCPPSLGHPRCRFVLTLNDFFLVYRISKSYQIVFLVFIGIVSNSTPIPISDFRHLL